MLFIRYSNLPVVFVFSRATLMFNSSAVFIIFEKFETPVLLSGGAVSFDERCKTTINLTKTK
jgi:hypothetical protein